MSEKKRLSNVNQLKAGSILSYVNIAISMIIPLLYTPVMLRILGQAEYGIYSLGNSVIGYLSLFTFGMSNAVMRYVTKFKCKDDKYGIEGITGLFVIIFIVLGTIAFAVGIILSVNAGVFFGQSLSNNEVSKLKIITVIMTISTTLSFPSIVFSAIIVAYERYLFRRIVEIIGTVIAPILNLVALFLGYASVGMAVVGLIQQLIFFPIYVIYCKKVLDIHPRYHDLPYNMLKEIFGFSAFVFLSLIVDMLYWSTDKVLLGAMVGATAVAVYNIGGTFTAVLQNMASAISSVFVPRITQMVENQQETKDISELMIKIGRIQYVIVSLILSGYIVFGRAFIHFWAGDNYKEAYIIALLTMIPLAVPLIQNVAYNTLLAKNKHQFRAILYFFIAVFNIIGTILMIPKMGIVGAALCTAIAFLIGNGIIMNIYYYKIIDLDIPKFWSNILKMSKVPIVMIICGLLIQKIIAIDSIFVFLISVGLYFLIYCYLTWFFSLNMYEKNLIVGLFDGIKKRKRG